MAILVVVISFCVKQIFFSGPQKYPVYYESMPESTGEQQEENIYSEIDFNDLREKNDEIYAWIYIPDTKINYPVVQSKTDNEFYLRRNEYKKNAVYGSIFTENHNTTMFTDYNTVLYGHNMLNGSMFADLLKYKDQGFFDSHRDFYIYTPEKAYQYKVFAAYFTDDSHVFAANDFSTEEGYREYIDTVKSQTDGSFDKTLELTVSDRIITLSTCYAKGTKRFLVQAFLEKKMGYIEK